MGDPVTLKGRFVELRPLTPDDAAITFDWRGGARARLLNKAAASEQAQEDWIRSRPANEHNWMICIKAGQPVGMVSLVAIDPANRHAEPGRFLIGDEQAVAGVPAAVEAMLLVYQFAFDTLGLVRLFGTIAEGNNRMVKWQKYLGMREEGRMRRHYFIDGRFRDALMFGLLADEYRAEALPRMRALIGMTRSTTEQELIR